MVTVVVTNTFWLLKTAAGIWTHDCYEQLKNVFDEGIFSSILVVPGNVALNFVSIGL